MAANVSIIGLGLIGTSLGMALKGLKIKGLKITGHDREPLNAKGAQKKGAADVIEWNLPASVRNADLVIIATPVGAIKDIMTAIAGHLPQGAVVTDTGSSKVRVMAWAEGLLPDHVSFVGGHPMAGKETSGPEGAEATLFKNATYCLIPGKNADKESVGKVVSISEAIGAKPLFIDPVEHDSFVAAVSHLPLVVSSVLMLAASKSPAWHEMARLASSGFKDTTRLASGDPVMSRDICTTNINQILPWVDRYIAEMQEFRRLLESENEEHLAEFFASAYEQRERWAAGVSLGPQLGPKVDIPTASDTLTSMLVGDLLARKHKQIMETHERDRIPGRDGERNKK